LRRTADLPVSWNSASMGLVEQAARFSYGRLAINDRRDDMTLAELVEELELSYPEKVAGFERRYPDAMAAVVDDVILRSSTIAPATFEGCVASELNARSGTVHDMQEVPLRRKTSL
jgi:hypothetical protein